MRNKLVRLTLVIFLIVAISGGFAFIGTRVTDNAIMLQKLSNSLSTISDVNNQNLSVISKTLRNHKKTLKSLKSSLIEERSALIKRGEMTEALAKLFSQQLINLDIRISSLNLRLTQVEQSLNALLENRYQKHAASLRRMYETSLKCSVFVKTSYYSKEKPRKDKEGKLLPNAQSSGSGTVVSIKNGNTYILTAAHVINPLKVQEMIYNKEKKTWERVTRVLDPKSEVTFFTVHTKSSKSQKVEVLFKDVKKDLAILVIKDFTAPAVAEIANKEDIKSLDILDPVYVVGCPLGATPRINKGEVTAWVHARKGYIESNCQIIWGNSGGGLFKNGKIIGVVSLGRGVRYQMVESLGLCVSPKVINAFMTENKFSVKAMK